MEFWLVSEKHDRYASDLLQGTIGSFEVEYLLGSGRDFDLGVNYLQCGNLSIVKRLGAEEFTPYICMSYIALSDALKWGLIRTYNLADGFPFCDFRFKKGAATQISSKTPDVQAVIERICSKERDEGISAGA